MQWVKTIGRFFLFAIKPLRHAESFWGWVDLIIQVLIILGIFASVGFGITSEKVRWLLTIATPSLIALLFLIAGVRLQRRLSEYDEISKIRSGDTVKDRIINVSMLFENKELQTLDNVTFIRCTLRGPCLVTLRGQTNISRCSFWGGTDYSNHLILADENRKYSGIGAFMHCNFQYCQFDNIAWLVNQNDYDKFLSFPRVSS